MPDRLEAIKKSLIAVGFSLEEAEQQIEEVGKLITMAILHRLLQEKAEVKELTLGNIEKFLKDNFTVQYLKLVVEEESQKIVQEYLKATKQG